MNKTNLDRNFIFFFFDIKLGKLANMSSVITDELNSKSYSEISNFTNELSIAYHD